jgi:hypothetical protein
MEDNRKIMSMKDENALAILNKTIGKIGSASEPRYEIGLTFLTPPVNLPNNRSAGLRRLYAVESHFHTDPV